MAWAYLALAALFEIAFALSMKASEGFTRPLASLATVAGVAGGITFLTLAMRELPVGVAYPVWVGAGALGAVLFGVLIYGEALNPLKLASVATILIGVVGLKLASAA